MNLKSNTTTEKAPSSTAEPGPSSGNSEATKRLRLVSLLRGYFATPIIATLGELGIAERMLEGSFHLDELAAEHDRRVLRPLFRYLHSIGILELRAADEYRVTMEGRTVLTRNGAFSLLLSYAPYFDSLASLLLGEGETPVVNRVRNVRGSGHLHARKFFPAALELCALSSPKGLIDVGCGDGMFLDHASHKWAAAVPFGVDLSEAAVEATHRRLSMRYGDSRHACVSDGYDIATWVELVPPEVRQASELVISMWFVAHEFSNGSVDRMVKYFATLRSFFPNASLLLGEICNIPAERLAVDYARSIMPEFLLFHDLSGQGVLSWRQWQEVRERIPYSLKGERRFDEVKSLNDDPIPASFLWLLDPQ